MKYALIILLISVTAGCGSLNIQKVCRPVEDQVETYVCKKLGFFE